MSTPTETLAIMLQRAKTHMETTKLSTEFNETYRDISRSLFDFESFAEVDAVALRDAADEGDASGVKRWYIETDDGERRGPYNDYDDCCADADRLQGQIIESRAPFDEITNWECPSCNNTAGASADTLVADGTPYCSDCDCEMDLTD